MKAQERDSKLRRGHIALPQQLWLFAGIRACRQHAKAKLAKTLEVSDPGPAACQQC